MRGWTSDVLDSGCCGLAGNFGFEKGHYEVSEACGERVLMPAVRAADAADVVLADGFSCRTQIEQGDSGGRGAVHLAELLRAGLHGDGGGERPGAGVGGPTDTAVAAGPRRRPGGDVRRRHGRRRGDGRTAQEEEGRLMTTNGTPNPGTSTGTSATDTATGELLKALSADVSAIVRQELRHAQDEMAGKARQAGAGGALLGGAAVLGAAAAGTATAFLVRSLDAALPRPASAAVATVLLAAGAAALAAAGAAQVRRALPLLPEETVDSVRADLAATTGATGRP